MRVLTLAMTCAVVVASAAAMTCAACGPVGGKAGSADRGARHDGGISDPNAPPVDPSSPDPPNCGSETFVPQKAPDPDILILMDISGSMAEGSPTKYSQTSRAISRVVGDLEAAGAPVQFGLELFPQDRDCGVSRVDVPVGPGTAAHIQQTVLSVDPGGNTPAAKALDLASQHLLALSDGRAKYILIATDGQPNCESASAFPTRCKTDADCDQSKGEKCQPIPILGGICERPAGSSEAVDKIRALRAQGIRTFVVGIAIDGGHETLEAMAEGGGTARQGSPLYYPVGSETDLVNTLTHITEMLTSCVFVLSKAPPTMEYVGVTVGDTAVLRDPDHQNGWDITGNTLEFFGPACDYLLANPGTVEVTFGCKPPE